jgi:hypothetical protein
MSTNEKQFKHKNRNAGKRLAWVVFGISSACCALLLTVLFTLNDDNKTSSTPAQNEEIIDLLAAPRQETGSASTSPSNIGLELPLGGWVQQTDTAGNLVQQYRCKSLDPDPVDKSAGWIEMKNLEVEMYLGDDKLVRISGDTAIANAPNRVLESGEIVGNVEVKMFEVETLSKSVFPEPIMVLKTHNATFDNFIGEIICPNDVKVTSTSQTLAGRTLSLRFNDKEERIEYLHLEELDYIDFLPIPPSNTSMPTPVAQMQPHPSQIVPRQTSQNRDVKAAAVGSDLEYYIVTLAENVKILQGEQGNGRLARGKTLTIAFSNKSESYSKQNSNNNERFAPMTSHFFAQSIPITLVATSFAALDAPLDQQITRVTCEGGLTMIPLDDPSLIPSTPTDTRIELFAFDDAPAQLIDTSQNMEAFASMLRYELQQDRSDLFGEPASLLIGDKFTTANHLWLAREDGLGGVTGEGTMVSTTPQSTGTSLQWSDNVDFTFDSSQDAEDGSLKEVICHGDVVLSDEGNFVECETLTVTFSKNPDGTTSPSLAIANENVKAITDDQTMWANEMRVSFSEKPQTTEDSHKDESMFGGSKANKMKAIGNVQILLRDGGRAFCETFDGNIAQDTAMLNGNVVIAYERMFMNRGESASLILDRATGKGKWAGPGQALFLDSPIDVSQDHRIERPIVDSPTAPNDKKTVSMRANWGKEMNLDQKFNDGAGAIDLKGDVDVQSRRTKFERSQMTGDDLRFEFTKSTKNTDSKKKDLEKVIARTGAQIEHRTWDDLYPSLPPVVYYIGGDHLEFNLLTQETLAVGNGELVLRDPREAKSTLHQSALAGRGTTRFTWDDQLISTQLKGDEYLLEMTGNVEMIHKGTDGTIGMLTSDKIEAIAIDPSNVKTNDNGGNQLTLRGLDLQKLIANGSVYVATETKRVDCDKFNYDLITGFATLSALENRSVAIITGNSPYPVRASNIIWNMDPTIDSITIRDLQGTSND